MAVSLIDKEQNNTIRMSDLKDGQLAEVMSDSYPNTIVQRYGNNAVAIGRHSGFGWSLIQNNSLRVRLLEEDELIKVFNNDY